MPEGEKIWCPSGNAFLKRALLASAITAFVLSGGGILFDLLTLDPFSLLAALGILLFSIVFYMIIFDEWQNWNRHRNDEWRLTWSSLGFRNLDESMAFSELPLDDIKNIKLSLWRGLRIRLTNGRAFHMSYLADTKSVRDQIMHNARISGLDGLAFMTKKKNANRNG